MSALRRALRDLPEAVFADLLETEDAYLLVIDVPGVTAATADVSVEGGRLRIETRRDKDEPPEFRYVRENRSLFLDAEVPLPPGATEDGASANVDRGVLEVTLPKRGAESATGIEVRSADDE
jgi:HSP20 family molecular chaperone IbpA